MPGFWFFILQCFYFMMPIYFANMSPVFMRKTLNFMAVRMDFGKRLGGKPILGEHKTWRGSFYAIVFGILTAFLQYNLYRYEFFRKLSFFDYSNWLLFGFLMGFGAIFGDSVKSFFKRRVGIKPGDKFIPFDQIDFVVGGMALSAFAFDLTLGIFIVSLILSFVLDIIVNHIAFYLHIRNEKW